MIKTITITLTITITTTTTIAIRKTNLKKSEKNHAIHQKHPKVQFVPNISSYQPIIMGGKLGKT